MEHYKWPRENLCEYLFDAEWPIDVKPEEIMVPFTSWYNENNYRISQKNRLIAEAEAIIRDRQLFLTWIFGLYS